MSYQKTKKKKYNYSNLYSNTRNRKKEKKNPPKPYLNQDTPKPHKEITLANTEKTSR